MKKIVCLATLLAFFSSCERDDLSMMQQNLNKSEISLNSSNTYFTGEPVRFDISGDPDNIVFFSGEPGHEYRFKDRTSSPPAEGSKVQLGCFIGIQYGGVINNSFNFRVLAEELPEFTGDVEVDRNMIKNKPWEILMTSQLGDSRLQNYQTFDLTKFTKEPFTLCFSNTYTHPIAGNNKGNKVVISSLKLWLEEPNGLMRTIAVGSGIAPFTSICFYDQHTGQDVYKPGTFKSTIDNKWWGHWDFVTTYNLNSYVSDEAQDAEQYDDAWMFLGPVDITKIDPDKGLAIKELSTDLRTFSSTYNIPGTYTATFVLSNSSTKHRVEKVIEHTFTIVDDPNKPLPPVEAGISLVDYNTFKVGTPVKFNVVGDPRAVVLFSGEPGHEFKYRDRTSIPIPDGVSVMFDFKAAIQYGGQVANSFNLNITKDNIFGFTSDATVDRKMVQDCIWENLLTAKRNDTGYNDLVTAELRSFDITDYSSYPFTLAFTNTYLTKGEVTGDKGNQVTIGSAELWLKNSDGTKLRTLYSTAQLSNNFRSICLYDQHTGEDIYKQGEFQVNSKWAGHWRYASPNFTCNQAKAEQQYDDAWMLFGPFDITKVEPDTGIAITQEELEDFSYIFNTAGEYTLTFVFRNATGEEKTEEFTITIAD